MELTVNRFIWSHQYYFVIVKIRPLFVIFDYIYIKNDTK